MKKTLSVIMPVYNSEDYLKDAIESILNQSFQDFILYLCDDKSTDKSKEIINNYNDSRIVKIFNEKNLGKNITVNNVLKQIDSIFFTVHDSDDISHKDRFYQQIKYLKENPNIMMCGTSFYEINENNNILNTIKMPTNIKEIKDKQSFPDHSCFHGPTLIIRVEVLNKVGGFYRKYFRTGEDIEFCCRLVEKYNGLNLKNNLYYYRIHSKSLTKSVKTYLYHNVAHIEFGRYLQKVRRQQNKDLYVELSNKELHILFNKYLLDAKKNQTKYFKTGIDRSLYFNSIKNALLLNFLWLKIKPLDLLAYKYLFSIILRYLKIPKNNK